MTKYRVALIVVLFIAPFLFLMGAGWYYLWTTGLMFSVWWPMAASLTLGYGLLWYWTRRRSKKLLPETATVDTPAYWTDRDQKAWKIVEAMVTEKATPSLAELGDANRYASEALVLAHDIAKVYVPGASDPFSHLTLPEILTCGELVSEDLSRRVGSYALGSHLLTIGQMRRVQHYTRLGQKAWDLAWLPRLALNPLKAGTQFVASKAGGSILAEVQNNVLDWFHTAYLHEMGRYLIELNSGRLKVGAARYRELLANHNSPETAKDPVTLTLALCGAVKAGKSSLINALLGEDRAGVDVIPLTAEVTSYEMKVGDLPALLLLDTPGYGESGPSSQELAAAFDAAKRADLLVLVTPARTAARKADVEFLAKLTAAFEAMPALKLPPVVIALSHADLLTPAAEWAPPYDWKKGIRPKETTMRDAVLAAQEQLGPKPTVPIVTLPEKLFNVHEGLLPTLAGEVPQARGSAILRLFARDGSAGAGKKALEQALNIGREALRAVWESVKAK